MNGVKIGMVRMRVELMLILSELLLAIIAYYAAEVGIIMRGVAAFHIDVVAHPQWHFIMSVCV